MASTIEAIYRSAWVATVMTLGLPAAGGAEETYPAGPVRIVVPFPAGGPVDFVARLLGDKFSTRLGRPFVVDNRPGANGNIGTDSVAKSSPDGQTLLFVLGTTMTVNPALYPKLTFDPERDFRPIAIVGGFAQMLVLHPSIPANSVAEFVEYAKQQRQRPITYATGGGSGSPGHLTMEYFRAEGGFPALQVPYKGNAPATMDLIAGHVQSGFLITAGVLEQVRQGKLKAIALSGMQRTSLAPTVPTIAESGYPSFNAEFYFVLLAPRGVSEAIGQLLEREVGEALRSPDVQEKIRAQDIEPVVTVGREASVRLAADRARWARIIKSAGIKPD
jgi:tripartite-type tricarboxylate transporter receptor subunit TctC